MHDGLVSQMKDLDYYIQIDKANLTPNFSFVLLLSYTVLSDHTPAHSKIIMRKRTEGLAYSTETNPHSASISTTQKHLNSSTGDSPRPAASGQC